MIGLLDAQSSNQYTRLLRLDIGRDLVDSSLVSRNRGTSTTIFASDLSPVDEKGCYGFRTHANSQHGTIIPRKPCDASSEVSNLDCVFGRDGTCRICCSDFAAGMTNNAFRNNANFTPQFSEADLHGCAQRL